ncbi:MAG TPA: hypothetical protein VGB77_05735, partial [Abditibacteriaceae bacterium]
MRARSVFVFVMALFGVWLSAACAQPPAIVPAPATVDDWTAYGRLEKQLEKTQPLPAPQVAIEAWKQLYDSRPNLLPQIGINISVKIADL